jgi:hypothetical protein
MGKRICRVLTLVALLGAGAFGFLMWAESSVGKKLDGFRGVAVYDNGREIAIESARNTPRPAGSACRPGSGPVFRHDRLADPPYSPAADRDIGVQPL